MSKRSVNFTGRKPMKAGHILSMMEWLGMTEEEIRGAIERQKAAQVELDRLALEAARRAQA